MSTKINPISLRINHNCGTEVSLFAGKNEYAKIWKRLWSLRRWSQLILQSSLRVRKSSGLSQFRRKKAVFNLSKIWTKTSYNKIEVLPIIQGYPRTGIVWKYAPIRIPFMKKKGMYKHRKK